MHETPQRALARFVKIQRKISCVSEVSLLDCLQMESAFSETRRAAELLQQLGGFPFVGTKFCFPPLVDLSHAPYLFLPCASHGVSFDLGTLSMLKCIVAYFSGEYLLR